VNENSELNSETPLIEGGEIVEEEIVDPVFCTMEVMECPDGSFVGRVAPTCEFAACSGLEAPIETEGEIAPELIEEPVLDPMLEEPELIELTVE
ncbi:hypothetical protein JXK06_02990, partial [Patescibacteria group bacterium]|nr:hypothetical protein [Patescibacteria group bacterium]